MKKKVKILLENILKESAEDRSNRPKIKLRAMWQDRDQRRLSRVKKQYESEPKVAEVLDVFYEFEFLRRSVKYGEPGMVTLKLIFEDKYQFDDFKNYFQGLDDRISFHHFKDNFFITIPINFKLTKRLKDILEECFDNYYE